MSRDLEVKRILLNNLRFTSKKLKKLEIFVENLLFYNKKRNLISKNTESFVWNRHILDSAQLIKFIDPIKCNSISDLGSGAGFPGLVLAIFFDNFNFHVKLYEKSPTKSAFLQNISKKLELNCKIICSDVNSQKIESNYIVCRAFKKLPYILNISRENCINNHKIIILKGKSAQEEIKKAFKTEKFKYRLEKSITDNKSRIIIIDANNIL